MRPRREPIDTGLPRLREIHGFDEPHKLMTLRIRNQPLAQHRGGGYADFRLRELLLALVFLRAVVNAFQTSGIREGGIGRVTEACII